MLPQSCWWRDFYWFFQLFCDTTKSKADLNLQFCYKILIDYMTIVSKEPVSWKNLVSEETLIPLQLTSWLVVVLKWTLGQVKMASYLFDLYFLFLISNNNNYHQPYYFKINLTCSEIHCKHYNINIKLPVHTPSRCKFLKFLTRF